MHDEYFAVLDKESILYVGSSLTEAMSVSDKNKDSVVHTFKTAKELADLYQNHIVNPYDFALKQLEESLSEAATRVVKKLDELGINSQNADDFVNRFNTAAEKTVAEVKSLGIKSMKVAGEGFIALGNFFKDLKNKFSMEADMSSLIVDVCAVEEIAVHPNADRIERVRVKNWWCIASKGYYKVGDKVVYVPPDSVISKELGERWGIAKYCIPYGENSLRIRASRFRGVSSFGTIQNPDDPSWAVGTDVREHYGITKYEPPVKASDGDAEKPHPAFHAYTDIENLGNFPGVFADGESVVVTEKIHGTNCRVGFVKTDDTPDGEKWEWMAGSHSVRRKQFNDKGVESLYWMPLKREEDQMSGCGMLTMYVFRNENARNSVIVFGEIFGSKVQDMTYGQNGQSFRVFDISVDGNYLDYEKMKKYVELFSESGVHAVPVLYEGPFSMEKMNELVDGPTTICSSEQIKGAFKGREGIVIKPVRERVTEFGHRCVLKYISVDYHERKNGTEFH